MKTIFKILAPALALLAGLHFFSSCKKDKFTTDPGARVHFSQDSVLFDTVFTSVGSATQNIRVRNRNKQKIKISSIQLAGGSASAFKINVDGSPGTAFSDIEIAANDSMYIFLQVNVDPNNNNSPFVIRDSLLFTVNGNLQTLQLEAWGQNAYYHRPTDAIQFKNGYLPFSYLNNDTNAISVTWTNDKPHVIYGYLAVYTGQKLTIDAGARIYMTNHAGLWIYKGGELHVHGQKGNEVIFQGVRREKDYEDMPGQWDRIWINEGSANNEIDYAIIKNGYIGIQAENLGGSSGINPFVTRRLKLTNTKIQNMSLWGIYSVCYNIYGANNVVSNCQEHSLNIQLGGKHTYIHCTFANFWEKEKAREKATVNINNNTETDVWPMDSAYFGNCIIDGKLASEFNLDLKTSPTPSMSPQYWFSNCWIKTGSNTNDPVRYINIRKGTTPLSYNDIKKYDFVPAAGETRMKGYNDPKAQADAQKFLMDIALKARNTTSVTAGAYEAP